MIEKWHADITRYTHHGGIECPTDIWCSRQLFVLFARSMCSCVWCRCMIVYVCVLDVWMRKTLHALTTYVLMRIYIYIYTAWSVAIAWQRSAHMVMFDYVDCARMPMWLLASVTPQNTHKQRATTTAMTTFDRPYVLIHSFFIPYRWLSHVKQNIGQKQCKKYVISLRLLFVWHL